jgi:hypothetical protein
VLKKILRPITNEVMEYWRIIHDEELQNLYSSPNIVTAIKTRRIR